MIRRLALSLVIAWLLVAGFWAFALDFNQYGWSGQTIVDCDSDAEVVVATLIWLVWLTAILLAASLRLARRGHRLDLATLALGLALLLGIGLVPRYASLVGYEADRDRHCSRNPPATGPPAASAATEGARLFNLLAATRSSLVHRRWK
jgi:hypothetical protein